MTDGFNGRLAAELNSALTDSGVNIGSSLGYVVNRITKVISAEVAAIVSNPEETAKAETDAKLFSDALAKAQAAQADAAAAEAEKNSQAVLLEQARQALTLALDAIGNIPVSPAQKVTAEKVVTGKPPAPPAPPSGN